MLNEKQIKEFEKKFCNKCTARNHKLWCNRCYTKKQYEEKNKKEQ